MGEDMRYKATFTCEKGHSQTTRLDASLGRGWAEQWMRLLDGTSPLYLYPPKPGEPGVIGRCGICGSPIKGKLTEESDGPVQDE
jgi:hypothetical protein